MSRTTQIRSTQQSSSSRRAHRALAGAALVVLTAGGLAACGSKVPTKADSGDSSAVTSTSTTLAPTVTTTADPNGGNNSGGNTSGGNTSGGNTSGGNTSGGNTSGGTGTAPTIVSFTTPESIDCHNGNFQQFSASWTTQGATKVTISIDGPGIYNTYGPNDEASLPFNCSTSHTFLLTAFGPDGATSTKQITLQPRNAQPSGDDSATS